MKKNILWKCTWRCPQVIFLSSSQCSCNLIGSGKRGYSLCCNLAVVERHACFTPRTMLGGWVKPLAPSRSNLQKEVRGAMEALFGPKTKIHFGAWNVRTIYETSKTTQVLREMKRYHLDILGISVSHWKGSGCQVLQNGSVILHSGHENTHTHGVAIIIFKAETLLE